MYHGSPSSLFWDSSASCGFEEPRLREVFKINRGSSGLLASKALIVFLQFKTAEGLTPATLVAYEQILRVWVTRFGDRPVDRITSEDLRNRLAWLRTEYKP